MARPLPHASGMALNWLNAVREFESCKATFKLYERLSVKNLSQLPCTKQRLVIRQLLVPFVQHCPLSNIDLGVQTISEVMSCCVSQLTQSWQKIEEVQISKKQADLTLLLGWFWERKGGNVALLPNADADQRLQWVSRRSFENTAERLQANAGCRANDQNQSQSVTWRRM